MEKSVLEGNKLIAEFMGGKFHKATEGHLEEDEYLFPDNPCPPEYELKQRAVPRLFYHKSWNWLMPVVQKIWKEYQDGKAIGGTTLDIFYANITATIEAVYLSVIEYINWKNENH